MAELDGVPVDVRQLQALALVNYGHFTSMEVVRGQVRGLSLHLERLVRDCRRVFGADLDPDRVRHLPGMDAVFATNAATGVRPVTAIDDVHWPGDHPVLRAVVERYAAINPEPL